ncbi:hypothetical protein E2C01_101742 [Portunus trituberculatus]|uniref:Uncharacterized protein n=1 Tax=Portunus trituberculatus TaxID=210409 RepID=A0A5B7KGT8_PORTR|nr:hypothetical protein [Portunus trituberculatus]
MVQVEARRCADGRDIIRRSGMTYRSSDGQGHRPSRCFQPSVGYRPHSPGLPFHISDGAAILAVVYLPASFTR